MIEIMLGVGCLLGVVGAATLWYRAFRKREFVRARLSPPVDNRNAEPPLRSEVPFVRRNYWLPWLVGIGAALSLLILLKVKIVYALLPGLLVGLLGMEVDRMRVGRRSSRIESQLADSIDLMVGALHVGGSVLSALDYAVRESRWPLRPQLEEVVGRIHLGDNASAALSSLARRVPLENFVLFSSALAVHWEVGGSLASTLALVGRSIRDRIEIGRRVHSLSAQSRASIIAVIGATYFIALVIWRNSPERMETFVKTNIGAYAIGFAILLQAIGIVWSASISRLKF
jgi:tight adherence protein B